MSVPREASSCHDYRLRQCAPCPAELSSIAAAFLRVMLRGRATSRYCPLLRRGRQDSLQISAGAAALYICTPAHSAVSETGRAEKSRDSRLNVLGVRSQTRRPPGQFPGSQARGNSLPRRSGWSHLGRAGVGLARRITSPRTML